VTELRLIRQNQGLSRSELAVKARVGEKTIFRAETGQPVRRITLAKICRALGVKIEEVEGLNILE
jgi:DNA-binding XRE family transcriptional regulator